MLESFSDLCRAALLCVTGAVLSAALAAPSQAKDITLAWDGSAGASDASTYIIRYGTGSGDYALSTEVGNQTTATLQLPPGMYYATAVIRDANGLESAPSEELVFWVDLDAPALAGLTDGQSLNGGELALRAADFGPDVTRVEFYVNGSLVGQAGSAAESANWAPPQAGDFTLTVRGYDAAGHTGDTNLVVHVYQPAVAGMARRAEDQAFELTVTGAPGRMQHVYVSDDLQTWTLLESRLNATGQMVVADTAAANLGRRFYRVASE